MKTVVGVTTTPQGAGANAEHVQPAPSAHGADEGEPAEEAFEAAIVQLDGAAIAPLLRQLGE